MCKYCENGINAEKIIFHDRGDCDYFIVAIHYNELFIQTDKHTDSVNINYCPICGRKFEEVRK